MTSISRVRFANPFRDIKTKSKFSHQFSTLFLLPLYVP